jgi:hypothetical protein
LTLDKHDDIRKELDALDGQTIVLPNDAGIEVIECNGDAFKVYQDAINDADATTYHGIIGTHQWRTCECSSCTHVREALERIHDEPYKAIGGSIPGVLESQAIDFDAPIDVDYRERIIEAVHEFRARGTR